MGSHDEIYSSRIADIKPQKLSHVCTCGHLEDSHAYGKATCSISGCRCPEFVDSFGAKPSLANVMQQDFAEANKKPEAVHHPAHYGGADNPYEHIKVVRAWGLNYELGNATKYICRAGKKDSSKTIEDLEKAAFYLNAEIERRKAQP